MWSEQPLETLLRTRLDGIQGGIHVPLYADYVTARTFVINEIAPNVGKTEPDLTDHSEKHLADVMSRTHDLISLQVDQLTAQELYLLCVSILFHDVGNIHGRANHQHNIAKAYRDCRGGDAKFKAERTAVFAIAGAHTGSTKDGSKDTLRELTNLSLSGQPVRTVELAAILRLADELAEGPHRTSAYMLNHGLIKQDSTIYHRYAQAADYCVEGERLALSLRIDLARAETGLEIGNGIGIEPFLQTCYKRVAKVDEERRYCKNYSHLLSRLKETSVWFEFWFEDDKLDLNMKPVVISDLVVPGDHPKDITQLDQQYNLPVLLGALDGACPAQ